MQQRRSSRAWPVWFAGLGLALLLVAPVAAQQALQTAQQQIRAGDLAGAAATLRVHVDAAPDDALGWYLLGYAHHAAGDMQQALEAHERAAGFESTRAGASYNAACALARLGRLDEALARIRTALDAGFADRSLLRSDPDLAALRSDPRFGALLPPLRRGAAAFVEPTRVLLELDGEAPGDQFGWVARNVGDLDGDGVDDFVATAPTHDHAGQQDVGRIYAFSSGLGVELFAVTGERAGERLGTSVAPAGDVDGDDVPDFIVGAPGHAGIPGRALVLSGVDGSLLRELSAGQVGDSFGLKVSGAGDVDGDGLPDLLVGAPGTTTPAGATGRCSVHSGRDGAELLHVDGQTPGERLGSSVVAVQEPGQHLLVLGAQGGGPLGTGLVRVLRVVDGAAEPHFLIEADDGGKTLGQYFVSIPGDFDGDGLSDVYASDWNHFGPLGPNTGRIYVCSGQDGARLLTLTGDGPGQGFGTSPSEAGDVNADGVADLIVGAWQHAGGARSGGRVTLHDGRDGAVLASWTCREVNDTFGFDATGLGDVDGDGGLDFLLTSGWSEVLGTQTGRVFVIAGPLFERGADAGSDPAR